MSTGKRNPKTHRTPEQAKYTSESQAYARSEKGKKGRADSGKARRIVGLKTGDSREVDHIQPKSKGGTNARSNLRVTSKKINRRKSDKA